MGILDIVNRFEDKDDQAKRAVFEAAMVERIQNEGYKMADLCYDVYLCHKAIQAISEDLKFLQNFVKPNKPPVKVKV